MKKNFQKRYDMKRNEQPSLLDRIASVSSTLTGQQMALARFIYQDPEKSAFLNSVQLSEAAKVSTPTVVRLAVKLGFKGFPDFREALRDTVRSRIRSIDRYREEPGLEEEPLFQRVLSLEFHVLDEMKRHLREESVQKAVDLLSRKRRIFIAGFLANICHAEYMAYFLGILREGVHLLTRAGENLFAQLQKAGPEDGAIIYSFPRYPTATQKLARYLKDKGVPIIGVTDSALSPLAAFSDILLEAPMKFISFIDPCAGAFALNHCLLTAFYFRYPEKMRETLLEFEKYSRSQNLFLMEDIDIVDLV
ncbi:MAG TPA: MurR/RpiR family transcriptional regulator [Synergistales bacterium]|jgi:DNA-binding MurR/RpiR family transcriptional regulator|nr:MurR/RpiR family transcriptional regulator [Synergistales bacterium]